MMKDIRKLIEEGYRSKGDIPEGHEARFLEKLQALPQHSPGKYSLRHRGPVWKIAASVVLLAGIVTVFFYAVSDRPSGAAEVTVTEREKAGEEKPISLSDLSPDLKKVEEYYMTAINWELSQVEVDPENKKLFDAYMGRLGELQEEYRELNRELNDIGPNEQTVNALINNLQLRLQLLYRLKNKLNELKHRDHEEISNV
ncbi:hypothetical protein [Sinomicrobium soli]|uniref:hypothetical protein n=1 Tax=Sinomicrobium sp. N-1-3-6 TaxID=2219864 RepID=UPI000DCE8016|nr:hypothetical protein [Sinomicrobium sp. N-1-3-6]RAV29793.1 hypothetical protein DN748_06685 [Sinomicrobium sp. N-1-3-6]